MLYADTVELSGRTGNSASVQAQAQQRIGTQPVAGELRRSVRMIVSAERTIDGPSSRDDQGRFGRAGDRVPGRARRRRARGVAGVCSPSPATNPPDQRLLVRVVAGESSEDRHQLTEAS